jgi:hypothetical protein
MRFISLGALIVAMSVSAGGASLNLVSGLPDIKADRVDIRYSGGTFTAITPTPGLFNVDVPGGSGQDFTIFNGVLTITAPVNSSGALGAGGTISITGAATLDPSNNPVLAATPPSLTGNLTAFGFVPVANSQLFEFTFDVTGGNLGPFLNFGSKGGVILNFGSPGFPGGFQGTFDNTGVSGTADVFATPVPTPATALGGVIVFGALAANRLLRRGTRLM